MEILFWSSLFAAFYAYFGYPLLLAVWGLFSPQRAWKVSEALPSVSVIMPAHNEEGVLAAKLENLLTLDFPKEKLEILVISDGSTDRTVSIAEDYGRKGPIRVVEITDRGGKANALNVGLGAARNEIVVFTDASIMLEADALKAIVAPFSDSKIGCVSGEDVIPGGGGEGMYGRYELFLRNLESRIGSIVGASGSFYAQRRSLTQPFEEGVAPDFLSVLNVVEAGHRAISEPTARGVMRSVVGTRAEFDRKVRTLLRGMAGLFARFHLLNPLKFGRFAWFLWSHKVFRWLVPVFLISALLSNFVLANTTGYQLLLLAQLLFYGSAVLAGLQAPVIASSFVGRVPLYFVVVNLAIIVAWWRYLSGVRQEIWVPSQR